MTSGGRHFLFPPLPSMQIWDLQAPPLVLMSADPAPLISGFPEGQGLHSRAELCLPGDVIAKLRPSSHPTGSDGSRMGIHGGSAQSGEPGKGAGPRLSVSLWNSPFQ